MTEELALENGDPIAVIDSEKKVLVDLNGQTLDYVGAGSANGKTMSLKNGADVTIRNGDIDMTGAPYHGFDWWQCYPDYGRDVEDYRFRCIQRRYK